MFVLYPLAAIASAINEFKSVAQNLQFLPFVQFFHLRGGRLQAPAWSGRLRQGHANYHLSFAQGAEAPCISCGNASEAARTSPGNIESTSGGGTAVNRYPGDSNADIQNDYDGAAAAIALAEHRKERVAIAAWNCQGGNSNSDALLCSITRVLNIKQEAAAIFFSENDFIMGPLDLQVTGWQVVRHYSGEGSRAMVWVVKNSWPIVSYQGGYRSLSITARVGYSCVTMIGVHGCFELFDDQCAELAARIADIPRHDFCLCIGDWNTDLFMPDAPRFQTARAMLRDRNLTIRKPEIVWKKHHLSRGYRRDLFTHLAPSGAVSLLDFCAACPRLRSIESGLSWELIGSDHAVIAFTFITDVPRFPVLPRVWKPVDGSVFRAEVRSLPVIGDLNQLAGVLKTTCKFHCAPRDKYTRRMIPQHARVFFGKSLKP